MKERNQPRQTTSPNGRAFRIGAAMTTLALVALLFSQTFVEISAFAQASQGRGPFFYPRFIMAAIALLALVMIIRPSGVSEEIPDSRGMKKLFLMFAIVAGYTLGLASIGFLLSSVIFALITPFILGYRHLLSIAAVATGFSLFTWWLFQNVFLIILPPGEWLARF